MPISSTNDRLTRELYKPPPKSLEQLRMDEGLPDSRAASRGRSNVITPSGSPMIREKHLNGGTHKKTAVVEPVKDFQSGNNQLIGNDIGGNYGVLKNGKYAMGADGRLGGVGLVGAGLGGAGLSAAGVGRKGGLCCFCQGLWCTRCCWLVFLLGLLIGALIAGLITGLVLGGRIEGVLLAAASSTTTSPQEPEGCFQSPCPSASAVCSSNNTDINCVCEPSSGEPVSSAEVIAEGYICSLYNISTSTDMPMMTTFS